jgi:hypothetical protein
MLDDFVFTPERRDTLRSPLMMGLSKLDLDFDATELPRLFPSDLDLFDFSSTPDLFSQPVSSPIDQPPDEFKIEIAPIVRPRPPLSPGKTIIYKPFSSFESAELTVRGLRKQLGRIIARSTSEPDVNCPA